MNMPLIKNGLNDMLQLLRLEKKELERKLKSEGEGKHVLLRRELDAHERIYGEWFGIVGFRSLEEVRDLNGIFLMTLSSANAKAEAFNRMHKEETVTFDVYPFDITCKQKLELNHQQYVTLLIILESLQ